MSFIYPCSVCDLVYTRKSDVKRHMLSHEKKYFRCPLLNCDYKSTQQTHMQTHVRTHTGEKHFACSLPSRKNPALTCTFKCNDSSSFGRHKKSQHGVLPKAPRARRGGARTTSSNPSRTSTGTTPEAYTAVTDQTAPFFPVGNAANLDAPNPFEGVFDGGDFSLIQSLTGQFPAPAPVETPATISYGGVDYTSALPVPFPDEPFQWDAGYHDMFMLAPAVS